MKRLQILSKIQGNSLSVLFLLFINSLFSVYATTYQYDDLNRLIRAQYEDGKTLDYSYDAAGNLISISSDIISNHAYDPVTGEEGEFLNKDDVPQGWIIGKAPDYDGDGINDILDDDDDNDGLLDVWELQYGFNPIDYQDALEDFDRDGVSNLEESQADSDPTDDESTPESVLPIQQLAISSCSVIDLSTVGTCAVNYQTSDGSNNNGISFRVHFDGNLLELDGTANAFANGLATLSDTATADSEDFDNDPSTTKYLTASWSSANWPSVSQPLKLFDISLRFLETVNHGQTSQLNFSLVQEVAGYRFDGASATVEARDSCNLDIDDDGNAKPLSDGLLILRYLFNMTGDDLINDVLSANSERNTASQIIDHLSRCDGMLDVDGDGETTPLNDGILIVRYLFGFHGDELTQNSVSNSAIRQSAEEIRDYLDALRP